MITDSVPIKPERLKAFMPILLGVIAFLIIVGPNALNPTNIAWLGQGDPVTHYLGWLFFRSSPWSFPIGLNPTYGLELSNSITFSDSNPLFAFLFKPFASWLPATFQYFGIWLLICFVLQAWFGWKLVGLFSSHVAIRLLATGIFAFAPSMIYRLSGHPSLTGHFLVLAALYLALRPKLDHRKLAWTLLLAVTALVHAYLLAMVGLIWLADLVWKTLQKKLLLQTSFVELILIGLLLGIVCWQAGYFSVGSSMEFAGFGLYRMNLLSLFDANGWSYILKGIPQAFEGYDGFHYLGLGVIFLLVCAIPTLWCKKDQLSIVIRRFPILLLAFVALTAFSLSNKISIGSFGYAYSLPDTILALANIFRVSERMFWPVYYAIMLGILFLIVRGNSKQVAISLLGLALVIQVVDTSLGWKSLRKSLMVNSQSSWETPLVDPFWKAAALKYKKIRWIQPQNHSPQWIPLATYAGTYKLATDAIYLARIDTIALEQAQRKAQDALKSGQYESDALYVFDDRAVQQAVFNIDQSSDILARIDGLNVLAPGWKQCSDCPAITNEIKLSNLFLRSPRLKAGQKVLFSLAQEGVNFLTTGWFYPESWGTWSQGDNALMIIPVSHRVSTIQIEADALVSTLHPKQVVVIKVNEVEVLRATLTKPTKNLIEFTLTPAVQQKIADSGLLQLQFEFQTAARPKNIGINQQDTRKLAMGLQSLVFN